MHWRRNNRFIPYTYKLMLVYLILLLLMVVIIGLYAYRSSIQSMTKIYEINTTRVLEQIRDNTLHQLNDYRKVSDQIYNDLNMQRLLQSKADSYRVYEITEEYLNPTLDSALKLTVNDVLLSLYIYNEEFKEKYKRIEDDEDPLLRHSDFNIYHMKRLIHQDWFQNTEEQQRYDRWIQIEDDRKFNNITLARRYISFDSFNLIGYLLVKVRMEQLFKSVDSFELSDGVHILVADVHNGSVLYSRSTAPSARWTASEMDDDHLLVEEVLPGTDWKLIAMLPNQVMREEANKIRNLTIGICLSSFAVAAGIGIIISRYFSARVKNILIMARSFHDGEFRHRVRFEGHNEFSYISGALNKMADNIEELIQEVYLKNIQKKEAELTALQAQINPHFLYNTLSSIRSMAKLGEVEKLSEMVSGLSKFYRYTLNNGKIIIPIAKELEQVQTYTTIQQIKHGNRFSFICEMDPSILHFDTIKIILQPFVENALKHAWYEDRMTIRIVARKRQGDIEFKIIDDGVGFRQDSRIVRARTDGDAGGYGVRNVDERIKLQFGPRYGVSLFSRPGIGTTVTILIPEYKHGKLSHDALEG